MRQPTSIAVAVLALIVLVGGSTVLYIARIHPGLRYGVTVEVREWTSPRELAAAETR